MQVELKALQRKVGMTFVFVTHDQGEALSMADRVAVFNQGRIVQVGSPDEIYERPRTRFVADFVGGSNVIEPEAAEWFGLPAGLYSLRPETDRRSWARAMTRRWARSSRPGTVGEVLYHGAMKRIEIDDSPACSLIAAVPSAADRADDRATRIRLAFDPRDALHPMEAADDLSPPSTSLRRASACSAASRIS